MSTDKSVGLIPKYDIRKVDGSPVDPGSEYFVLRLDDGASDPNHVAACRAAIITYAKHIEKHLPALSEDLKRKYAGSPQQSKSLPKMTPIDITLLSLFIPKIGSSDNEARGEIVRLNFRDAEKTPIRKQVVGNADGFDWIWVHLGRNYWKVTGKFKESPWSGQ